jgi:alkylated DNA repair dioxygenase AlkB
MLRGLKDRIEATAGSPFNSVLCNLYRSERDSMGMHADDEPELGSNPLIASLSLGDTRRFALRHTRKKSERLDLDLRGGSLLIMAGSTQHHWRHGISKQQRPVGPRINLTFRRIVNPA